VPVGAAVAGPDGSVVARGRNRIFDPPGEGLAGTWIAHAEIDALARDRHGAALRHEAPASGC
jgi:tRNA(Arg) A34 adenosine deaminase TadA